MKDTASLIRLIDSNTLKNLSTITPYRGVVNVIVNWIVIVTSVGVCVTFFHPVLYVLTVIFIGARQHALLILAHEAVHARLMTSRKLNDFVGKYLCATPLLLDFEGYKSTHLLHHRHLMSDCDPDWVSQEKEHEYHFPKNGFQIFYIFIRDVTGLGTYRLFQALFHYSKVDEVKISDSRSTFQKYLTPFVFLLVVILFFSTGLMLEFFMYWIVPAFTWLKWISYLRAIGEHHGLSYDMKNEKTKSRTTLTGWFGKLFITPHNANYHIEHHLYPAIPCYKLPKFHRLLQGDDNFRANTTLTHGYFNVIRECINSK